MEDLVFCQIKEDWEFNVLGLYNFNKPGKLDNYFQFLEENSYLPGNIAEIGVFKGSSILATAMFLKKIGSKKKVIGFDSFRGFPSYHCNDDLDQFKNLLNEGSITKLHYEKIQKNILYREFISNQKINEKNISTSGNFSDAPLESLESKIKFLGLDNIELVVGTFDLTLRQPYPSDSFMSVLMDCDLYESHKFALNSLWSALSLGGYIFLDEYYSLKFPGARIAVDEFFKGKKDKPHQHKKVEGDFERWYVRKVFGE